MLRCGCKLPHQRPIRWHTDAAMVLRFALRPQSKGSPPPSTCANYPPDLRGHKIVPGASTKCFSWNVNLAKDQRGSTKHYFERCIVTRLTQTHRSEAQSAKAEEEMRRCTDWLVQFMRNGEPKFLTKSELCRAAMTELKVSKNSFNVAWINAIEQTGRHDWYQPLRRRYRTKN